MADEKENKSTEEKENDRDVNSNEQIKEEKVPRKNPSEDDQERKDLNEHTRKDQDKVNKPYPKDKNTDYDEVDKKGRDSEKDKS